MTKAIRCGSYPFMNLAEDFGVAYGDVLLCAECVTPYVVQTPARVAVAVAAQKRIERVIGGVGRSNHANEFWNRLVTLVAACA